MLRKNLIPAMTKEILDANTVIFKFASPFQKLFALSDRILTARQPVAAQKCLFVFIKNEALFLLLQLNQECYI